jgi:HTH-type transcriptional repressor of NAD biosynthesis genes
MIAYGHKMDEFEKIRYSNKLLFVDTEIIVTQYFSELFSGKDPILESMAEHNYYDLWIYLEPDVAWVSDGFRTYGREEDRRSNNEKLKTMLDERGIAYQAVSGSYIDRITEAVKLIDKILEK